MSMLVLLALACVPSTCEDGSATSTGTCREDCDSDQFYSDAQRCVTIAPEDCQDTIDNDGDLDRDCDDADCDDDPACDVPWEAAYFTVSTWYGWDPLAGDGGRAIAYNDDSRAQNPRVVFTAYTDRYDEAFDISESCEVIAESPKAVPMAEFVANETAVLGWMLPEDAIWTSEFAGGQQAAGCSSVPDPTFDITERFTRHPWGVGIGPIEDDTAEIIANQVPEWTGFAVGSGFYSDFLAETAIDTGGFHSADLALPIQVDATFSTVVDNQGREVLIPANDALTGNEAMVVRGIGLYRFNIGNL